MIDNFLQISGLLKFEDPNEFYFIQIIQRGKDSGETGTRMIRYYCIFEQAQLDDLAGEIKRMCDVFNARAYIHLNRRDARVIGIDMLTDIAERIKQSNYSHLHRIHSTACGRHSSKKDKSWVIDLDDDKGVNWKTAICCINELQPVGQEKFIATIPTKNGCHLITRPFNLAEFSKLYPTIDVHKNNPTILYVP